MSIDVSSIAAGSPAVQVEFGLRTDAGIVFGGWTLDNYKEAWSRGNFGLHFKNSLYITVPAVVLTLFLSSLVAFVPAAMAVAPAATSAGVLGMVRITRKRS